MGGGPPLGCAPRWYAGLIAVSRCVRLRGEEQTAWVGLGHATPLAVQTTRVWLVEGEQTTRVPLPPTTVDATDGHAADELVRVRAGAFRCWRRTETGTTPGGGPATITTWITPGLPVPVRQVVSWSPGRGAPAMRVEQELVALELPGKDPQ